MPRFFFNLRNDIPVDDAEGQDLTDLDEARAQALRHARSIMAEDVKDGRLVLRDTIEVMDEGGDCVLTIGFRDAIEIEE